MSQDSKVRFLGEMGVNMQAIIKRLLANKDLLKLLTYTDKDPLSSDKPAVKPKEAYKNGDDGVVRIVPVLREDDIENSVITLRILRGDPSSENNEFLSIYFIIEIFVPNKQWIIASDNLRPYAIMGEIQKSLENKDINGLGKIRGRGFECNFFTEEISAFMMKFSITQFN